MLLINIIEMIRKAGSGTLAANILISRKRTALLRSGLHAELVSFEAAIKYGIDSSLICGDDQEPFAVTALGLLYVQRLEGIEIAVEEIRKAELAKRRIGQGGNVSPMN